MLYRNSRHDINCFHVHIHFIIFSLIASCLLQSFWGIRFQFLLLLCFCELTAIFYTVHVLICEYLPEFCLCKLDLICSKTGFFLQKYVCIFLLGPSGPYSCVNLKLKHKLRYILIEYAILIKIKIHDNNGIQIR